MIYLANFIEPDPLPLLLAELGESSLTVQQSSHQAALEATLGGDEFFGPLDGAIPATQDVGDFHLLDRRRGYHLQSKKTLLRDVLHASACAVRDIAYSLLHAR